MFNFSLILSIFFLLFISICCLFFLNEKDKSQIKKVTLSCSTLVFFLSTFLWIGFDKNTNEFQFLLKITWLPFSNVNFALGIDGISLFFILLTTFIIPICILSSWTVIKIKVKEYMLLFLFMEFLLLFVFCTLDLLVFYIFFESVLIPMGGILGS